MTDINPNQTVDLSEYAKKAWKTGTVDNGKRAASKSRRKIYIIIICICAASVIALWGNYFFQTRSVGAGNLDATGQFIPE